MKVRITANARTPMVTVTAALVVYGLARGPLSTGASGRLIDDALQRARGTPILAQDVLAEQVVLAGGRIWMGNPLDAFHLRRFPKQPEQDADAARLAVVKAVAAALLGHIFDIEIGRPAESGDGLIEQRASLLRGFILRSAGGWCLGAGRAEQEQQCNEQFIHLRR